MRQHTTRPVHTERTDHAGRPGQPVVHPGHIMAVPHPAGEPDPSVQLHGDIEYGEYSPLGLKLVTVSRHGKKQQLKGEEKQDEVFACLPLFGGSPHLGTLGVLDGHGGGAQCARAAAALLPGLLQRHLGPSLAVPIGGEAFYRPLRACFQEVDEELLNRPEVSNTVSSSGWPSR